MTDIRIFNNQYSWSQSTSFSWAGPQNQLVSGSDKKIRITPKIRMRNLPGRDPAPWDRRPHRPSGTSRYSHAEIKEKAIYRGACVSTVNYNLKIQTRMCGFREDVPGHVELLDMIRLRRLVQFYVGSTLWKSDKTSLTHSLILKLMGLWKNL